MTLIEVVAGLAILASVVTGILAVKSRVSHQALATEHRREAVADADALLASWWQNPSTFPREGAGSLTDYPGLTWHTHVVPNNAASALGTEIVRMEIIQEATIEARQQSLVGVEIMLPKGDPNASQSSLYAH